MEKAETVSISNKNNGEVSIRSSYLEDVMIQSDETSNRSERSKRSVSTRLFIYPQATVYSFLLDNDDEESKYYSKIANILQSLSLLFFLFAGIFFIISASWDYNLIKNEVETDDGVEVLCTDVYIFGDTNICTLQLIVAFLSGFGYFMNGAIDMVIARLYDKSNSSIKRQDDNSANYPTSLILEPMIYNSLSDISAHDMSSPLLRNTNNPNIIHKTPSIIFNITFSQEGVVATFLAMAGFIECIATLLEPSHEMLALQLYVLSSVLYLFEVIVALFGMLLCSRCLHSSDDKDVLKEESRFVFFLLKSGDVLFFIGSIVDLICSILWLFRDDLLLYSMSVFSAVLWTLDALLYITGGILLDRMYNNNHVADA